MISSFQGRDNLEDIRTDENSIKVDLKRHGISAWTAISQPRITLEGRFF
jgi:hypothetical protein